MRRTLLQAIAVAIFVGTPLTANGAFAAPTPKATITLVCDRGVDSRLDLTLYSANGGSVVGDPVPLECGFSVGDRSRLTVFTSGDAGWVVVTEFTFSTATGLGASCAPAPGSIPYRAECADAATGTGARLVVR